MKYSTKEYIKRYVILLIGFFIMAIGVALSTKANLGTSPVSCVPYVISLGVPYSMGNITIAMHVVFILIQILLLRKECELIQLLQLPIAVIFGFFTDLALYLTQGITTSNYLVQWGLVLFSCVIIAFGVNMEVKAGVVMLAGEGVMTAIAKVFHVEFGKVKMGFDCTQVTIGIVISFCLLGNLQGIREGTVAAAILVGLIVRFYNKKLGFVYEILGLVPATEEVGKEKEESWENHLVITIARQSCVIVGRLGCYFLKGRKNCLHVYLHGEQEYRIHHYQKESGVTYEESAKMLHKKDQERRTHFKYYTGKSMSDATNYDVCLNVSKDGSQKTVERIISLL